MRSEDANLRPERASERAHTISCLESPESNKQPTSLQPYLYKESWCLCAGLHFNKAGPLFMAFIGRLGEENGEKMIY